MPGGRTLNVAQHVETSRQARGSATALSFEGACWSFEELDRRASQTAHVLRRLGVVPGDRVALYLPNSPEWVVAYLAALKLGAIAVSLSAALRTDEVRALLADAEPRILVATPDLAALVPRADLPGVQHCLLAEAPPAEPAALDRLRPAAPATLPAAAMAPDAPAAIVYTSGTTGQPKGALLSHRNVVLNARAKVRYLGIRPDDRLLLFLPLHHCFGQNAVLNAALQAGATVVLQRRFDLDAVLAATRAGQVTMLFGVPASYALLLDRATPADLRGVRYCFSAAAPLPPDVEQRWQETFGLPIHQGYGLTETSPFASYNHLLRHKPGSVGTPIEGVEMKVVALDSGAELPPGEPGEILVRGHNVMLGYWRQPAETARAIHDGWFHTGDVGFRDDQGYFFLHDRIKDMVNVGGLKVYPAEVDAVLCAHPGVADAATYGAADPLLGEQLRAVVVPRPGATLAPEEVLRFCQTRLAAYKVPAAIDLRETLPRSPTGKILRRVLRAETAAGNDRDRGASRPLGLGSRRPGAAAVRGWILRWLEARLGPEPGLRDPRTAFADLGVSSVQAVQLAQELTAQFGVALQPTALWSYPTVDSLARHVVASAAPTAPTATTGSTSLP
jgi:long-chain acyl-CoA synthetase